MADYEQNLEVNLQDLCGRVHTASAAASVVSGVSTSPEADGGRRPLGVPTSLEDKIVQGAVAETLSAIYEVALPMGSPTASGRGRNPNQALSSLHTAIAEPTRELGVSIADIRSFFDSVNHEWLLPRC